MQYTQTDYIKLLRSLDPAIDIATVYIKGLFLDNPGRLLPLIFTGVVDGGNILRFKDPDNPFNSIYYWADCLDIKMVNAVVGEDRGSLKND